MRSRAAFTLVELTVALLVGALVLGGGIQSVHYFTRPAAATDLTVDRLEAFQRGAEKLERELREARAIIYPTAGGTTSRFVYVRTFEGPIVVWYYSPAQRALRRVQLDHLGLAVEDQRPPVPDLDGAYFAVNSVGLVSYALFTPGMEVIGAVRRSEF
jgi:type II secretory pathway pseudopilin PulG